jgi:hypothetical protein
MYFIFWIFWIFKLFFEFWNFMQIFKFFENLKTFDISLDQSFVYFSFDISLYHIFRLKYRCFVYALSMIVPSLYRLYPMANGPRGDIGQGLILHVIQILTCNVHYIIYFNHAFVMYTLIFHFISHLYIFPLIFPSDIVSINQLILIYWKVSVSVKSNSLWHYW